MRFIENHPEVTFYKSAGLPMHKLSVVIISLDEYKAIRLVDYKGLH